MSTAIACNRRPTTADYYSEIPMSNRCSTSSSSQKPIEDVSVSHVEENDLESRIELMLRERDDQWRRHEKSQIQFLQNETSSMLKSLHQEVNNLQNQLREAQRRQIMGEENEENGEENSERIKELEKKLAEKEMYTKNLEKKVTATIQKLQEQIQIQSERIRQLNDELNDRNQTVTHLSQQLRSIRLREAMATSQHRRRASQQTSPPLTSPSSPHRIFPPISTGLLSASVAVTYPGSKSSANNTSNPTSSSRRANSARRSPSMPN
ncbi:unnamed protein product [Caenorhabditis angaria]|uniref:CCDC92/74 N-terminal domain-containing protein n=1 Tax=Caenorhabditis angaria TaxID=860376 RepID=A0A9P1IB87_9PELO|nr:unnamed protein product [Caenorhabditis angaria]